MHTTRNGRLLTLSLGILAIGMGVLLVCERFQQVPVIPLRDGHVIVRERAVLIENGISEADQKTARW